jgi:HSP20 family molecular chaperone IbpA
MEINYSRFQRTIQLPGIQGKTRYSMEYRDGILLVRVQSL